MNALARVVQRHRRRIRLGRAAAGGVRGAFYTSLVVCALLAVARIAGVEVPPLVAWGVIAAVALAVVVREAGRSFTVRDCAIQLDRLLGLEERLSTALDSEGGPMREAQSADAAAALARSALPSRRLPREAKLLAGSALLVAALLVIRTPASAGGSDDPALAALTDDLAAKLLEVAPDRIDFREVAGLLKQGRTEEAAKKLRAIHDLLEEKLLLGGGGSAEMKKQLDLAASGAQALSAQLARMGKPLQAAPPVVAALKLERQALAAAPPGGPPELSRDEETARTVTTILERADWPPQYDAVIRRYYGSELR